MPVCHTKLSADLSVYVWRIDEDLDVLQQMAMLSDSEKETFNAYRSESRKRQWLAVRACANSVVGHKVIINYDAVGRPSLNDETYKYISISHAGDYVALLFGNAPHVGVDIENAGRNYKRVASKYVSEEDRLAFEQHAIPESLYLPIIWCAKEAAFKARLLEDVDFANDIRITFVNDNGSNGAYGQLSACFTPMQAKGKFQFEAFDGHYLVFGKYEDI